MNNEDKLEYKLRVAKYVSSAFGGLTIGLGISGSGVAATHNKDQLALIIGYTILTGVGYLVSKGVIIKTKNELLIKNSYKDDSTIEKNKIKK